MPAIHIINFQTRIYIEYTAINKPHNNNCLNAFLRALGVLVFAVRYKNETAEFPKDAEGKRIKPFHVFYI